MAPVKAADVFANALRCDELDDCVKTICDALRIPETGNAFLFSPRDRETYRGLLNGYRRAEFIKSWLLSELDEAAERVGHAG